MLITFSSILFLLLLFYLSMMPIVLFIDTKTNQYYLQVKGLVKASIESHEDELIRIRLKLFFLSFYFYPLRNIVLGNKKKTLKSTVNKKKIGKGIDIEKGLRLLKSFKVKRFLFDIDTGDCILNAKLYPLFAMLNYHVGGFSVNFEGRNRVELHIYSRPIYLIKSFMNL
ncbi:MAG: hypothetical protein A3F91_08890 [Flavobacteria bacterium RIFCSPLOWO2_12_FULL_35_11]|nr:MAG: hypothetical protein A3F91_08890 [Flavobacteria bacterium RIFCSPLOWO2_12_FULL_35_11]